MNYNFKKQLLKNEEGSILLYSLLIMITISTISITLTKLLIPKLRSSNEAISSMVALYTADSAIEWCLFSNRDDPLTAPTVPQQPTIGIGTASNPASYQIFRDTTISTCPAGEAVDYRVVAQYRGISRSLEISE